MPFDPSTAISALKGVASLAIKEGKYLYGVTEGVKGLVAELEPMVLLLQRLDGQQGNMDAELQLFSIQIRDLAFRSEDVVDTYFLNFHNRIENRNFLMKFACMVYNSYPIHQLGEEIESIKKEIKAINERLHTFRLVQGSPEVSSSQISERLQDTPGRALLLKDGFVVGLDKDIELLVPKLCETNCTGLSFVALVGIGGAGKTTLMKKVYNHPSVKNHFHSRALVCISQEWSGRWLLIEILRQMNISVGPESTKTALVLKLQEFLENKRYLIVLDDIWNHDAWNYIQDAFPNNEGSKILLTTRINDIISSISSNSRSNFIHTMKALEDKEKYQLIHKIAIEGRTHTTSIKEFVMMAKEMSKKCNGTPLAVVALAGVLSTKVQLHQWDVVKNAMSAHIIEGSGTGNYGSVEDMLSLSYCDLPSSLRSCMLYLGIYPEDWIVDAMELTRLWIGEGLVTIRDCQDQETLEDVGIRFLDELNKRCLLITIERNWVGEIKMFQVHDLVRDFCIKKAGEECFLKVIFQSNNHWVSDDKCKSQARRIIIHNPAKDNEANSGYSIDVSSFGSTTSLRSLIQLGSNRLYRRKICQAPRLNSAHTNFRLLKVLRLHSVRRLNLPDEIGHLTNLSYLEISNCGISSNIPSSIKNLVNLLIFDFRGTIATNRKMKNLFGKMEKLRQVYGVSIICDRAKTSGLGNSKKLQIFEGVFCEWMINDLSALESLRALYLQYITSQQLIEALYNCPSLHRIQVLHLGGSRSTELKINLLNLRQHCSILRELSLDDISIIEEVPSPVQFPPRLISLLLSNTKLKNRDSIVAIARLPHLKHLSLLGAAYIGEELIMDSNTFLQLEKLKLELFEIKQWRLECRGRDGNDLIVLPCLRELRIKLGRYYSFFSLPKELQYVTTLQELDITADTKFLERLREGGQDHHIVAHIPSVKTEELY